MTFRSIDITPMGAPRMTRADAWRRRPVIERYHAYRDELRLKLPHYQPASELEVTFWMPMPKSWSAKKRRAMQGAPHLVRPDVDNLVKAFTDAFGEDAHIYSIVTKKYWFDGPGMIDITIYD